MKTKTITLLIASILFLSVSLFAAADGSNNCHTQEMVELIGPPEVNNNLDRSSQSVEDGTIIDFVLPPWLYRAIDGIWNLRD